MIMSSSEVKCWTLSKYSLFKPHKNIQVPGEDTRPGCNGEWITKEDVSSMMKLNLTNDGHMLIQQNDVILENIFLPFEATSSASMKVLKKKDCLVFLHSHLSESRIFRVQFQQVGLTPNQEIEDCAQNLAKYFAVRSSHVKEQTKDKNCDRFNESEEEENPDHISPMVLVSKIMKDKLEDLPLVYRNQAIQERVDSGTDQSMENFICLCLADPTFPSYVGKVEKMIKKLTNEEESH